MFGQGIAHRAAITVLVVVMMCYVSGHSSQLEPEAIQQLREQGAKVAAGTGSNAGEGGRLQEATALNSP